MSPIQDFYSQQTIFLTGASGFLGKLIIEKILRKCPDIGKLYILLRPKHDRALEQRFNEIFSNSCFEPLRGQNKDFAKKVHILSGDCSQPMLGMSPEAQEIVKREVTCVIHAAANVRFDVDLKTAVFTNVRSVRDLMDMMKEMENLRAFVYVSTAFSHCYRDKIDEVFYDVDVKPEKLLQIMEVMDDRTLEVVTPHLLGEWPNTYVYTKAVAEEVIRSYKQVLPVAIVRPAVVISTFEDPLPGWINNFHGVVGVVVGVCLGVLRTLHLDENLPARVVPADYVVNNILAAAWEVEQTKNEPKDKLIPIYNFPGHKNNLITWDNLINEFKKFTFVYPLSDAVWYRYIQTTRYKPVHKIREFFYHTLFAYLVDSVLLVAGKRPLAVEKYRKISKLISLLSFFTTRSWTFETNNTERLFDKLDDKDKVVFNFDMKSFNWEKYWDKVIVGGRIYLLNDPLETVPKAKKKMVLLAAIHYVFIIMMVCLLYWFFAPVVKAVF
ncbi:fatty acyl-CoA reductase wat-like [Tribolium madens]|uniref:fatty acyl-CoA reductase wat-like n=1 Tax=Tribolium madens TaxID=41895 RepID=UPI001CF727F6|nr:fatty acyl-CoA reductase wat-like [Tribolium madens]